LLPGSLFLKIMRRYWLYVGELLGIDLALEPVTTLLGLSALRTVEKPTAREK
jgi:hypothetical protein